MLIHLKWTKTQIWRRNVCFWNLQVSWCACCWSRRWLATWSSKRSMAALSTSREKSTKCPHQRPKLSSPVSHWSCPMMWCCRYLWKKGTVHRRIGQQQGSYGFRLHYPHEKAISWKKKSKFNSMWAPPAWYRHAKLKFQFCRKTACRFLKKVLIDINYYWKHLFYYLLNFILKSNFN